MISTTGYLRVWGSVIPAPLAPRAVSASIDHLGTAIRVALRDRGPSQMDIYFEGLDTLRALRDYAASAVMNLEAAEGLTPED